jgi:hypothetical protein
MKGSIKDCDLGHVFAEQFARGPNSFDVVWIVKRSQIDAVLDSFQNAVVNEC